MSVMTCARDGCENILCTRYNPEFGYLCGECYNDLVDYLVAVNWYVKCSEGESPKRYIRAFLTHPKTFKFTDSNVAVSAARNLADSIFGSGG
jgi:hypothetical protein